MHKNYSFICLQLVDMLMLLWTVLSCLCSAHDRMWPLLEVQTMWQSLLLLIIVYLSSHKTAVCKTVLEITVQTINVKYIMQILVKTLKKQFKNSWGSYLQTSSEITEQMELFCNTHFITICSNVLMSFHQPGTRR